MLEKINEEPADFKEPMVSNQTFGKSMGVKSGAQSTQKEQASIEDYVNIEVEAQFKLNRRESLAVP